jgi:hypothetical protein
MTVWLSELWVCEGDLLVLATLIFGFRAVPELVDRELGGRALLSTVLGCKLLLAWTLVEGVPLSSFFVVWEG